MAVRVLHLRKLAELSKVHHVQGVKAPQGDCNHSTEYLLQHPGLQKQIWATNYIIGIPQATHDIYRLSSPPLHSSPPPQLPDTGAKPLFLPLRPFPTALSCVRMKPIYGCEVSNNFIHPSSLHYFSQCQILHSYIAPPSFFMGNITFPTFQYGTRSRKM